jgi:hypothetical protein
MQECTYIKPNRLTTGDYLKFWIASGIFGCPLE